MPQRRKSRGRSSRRGGGRNLAPVLKQIEENTRADRDYAPPQIPDKVPMPMKDKQVVTVKRTFNAADLSISTAGSTFGVFLFSLADFDSTSEFNATYLIYRIIEITINFIPRANFVSEWSSASTPANYSNIVTVIDPVNDTAPTTFAQLNQYKTVQQVRVGVGFSRTYTPHSIGAAYVGGGAFTARHILPSGSWFDTASNNVVYAGMRYGIGQGVGTGNNVVYTTRAEAVIQLKWAR